MTDAPERLWLPASDWKTQGQPLAPWIRASWISDAWTTGPNEGRGKSICYIREDQITRLTAERDAWRDVAVARSKLLACYRLGTQRGAASAVEKIQRAERKLEQIAAEADKEAGDEH